MIGKKWAVQGWCQTNANQSRKYPKLSHSSGNIHYGDAFVGVVGREDLLEFTVIGDTVNIAERVERLTRTLDAEIVVSRAFADAAGLKPVSRMWTLAPGQQMAGHSRTIDVFHFRNRDAGAQPAG